MVKIPESHYKALCTITEALSNKNINWAITGSVGMVLQGMQMDVHDIDLQADKAGVYAIEKALAPYIVKPVSERESLIARSCFGVLEINGVQVEIIGAIQKRITGNGWEKPVDPADYRLWVKYDNLVLPVLSLEHEYEAYSQMGRIEKAAKIRAFIDTRRGKTIRAIYE